MYCLVVRGSVNTSHSPLADSTSPWCKYWSCYAVAALRIVDVVIKSLLRCQTMDMFRHLYRSSTFAFSMLNTTVYIAHRLFTYLCFVHVNYYAWEKVTAWIRNISAKAACCAVFHEIPTLLRLHCCPCDSVYVPTRCCLMVSGIDVQGVTGGTDQNSGECCLGQTIPI